MVGLPFGAATPLVSLVGGRIARDRWRLSAVAYGGLRLPEVAVMRVKKKLSGVENGALGFIGLLQLTKGTSRKKQNFDVRKECINTQLPPTSCSPRHPFV